MQYTTKAITKATTKVITRAILLMLVLTGCNNLNDQSMYKVDFEHLVRSAIYTQQALLGLHLSSTTETDSARYALLINSYCDLLERGYIATSSKPKQCLEITNNLTSARKKINTIDIKQTDIRLCMTHFHRCFKNCSLRNAGCVSCEEQGVKCLN